MKKNNSKIKICFFGIYDKKYNRNDVLLKGMKLNDAEIIECNENAYDKNRYSKLIRRLRMLRDKYDVIICPFPATVPTIVAKIFSRKTVVIDALYSMYDAVVDDRKEISWFHPRAIRLLILDWLSVLVADIVICDTNGQIKYWSKWSFINKKKFIRVFFGVDDKEVYREETLKKNTDDLFHVHFHASFVPVHGIEYILKAAKVLEKERITFNIIGTGQTYEASMKMRDDLGLTNVNFLPIRPLTKEQLRHFVSDADVCLGSFGDATRLDRAIPGKTYEYIACGATIITSRTEGIKELFTDGKDIILCNHSDAEDLARKILMLKNDRELLYRVGVNAFELFKKKLTPEKVTYELYNRLSNLCAKK